MTGGVRFLCILAGIATLLCAFGFGFSAGTTLNYPEQQRYQPYRYAPDQPLQVDPTAPTRANPKAFQDRTPCNNPRGREESDLCAQWKAANAAENSALWTKWGFWIGVVGSALLLWQIVLTREAVEDTSSATKAMVEANEIAREDTRPILVYIGIEWDNSTGHDSTKLARFVWRNVGKRPLRLVRIDVGRVSRVQTMPQEHVDWVEVLPSFEALQTDPAGLIIMPDDQHVSAGVLVGRHHFERDLQTGEEAPQHVYLVARAVYVNAISGEHDREFATRIAKHAYPVAPRPRPDHYPPQMDWDSGPFVVLHGQLRSDPIGYEITDVADRNAVQMT